jgi:hypothetical protein
MVVTISADLSRLYCGPFVGIPDIGQDRKLADKLARPKDKHALDYWHGRGIAWLRNARTVSSGERTSRSHLPRDSALKLHSPDPYPKTIRTPFGTHTAIIVRNMWCPDKCTFTSGSGALQNVGVNDQRDTWTCEWGQTVKAGQQAGGLSQLVPSEKLCSKRSVGSAVGEERLQQASAPPLGPKISLQRGISHRAPCHTFAGIWPA